MSQKIVFDILKSFDNREVHYNDLIEKIENEFPNRSLSGYIKIRLNSLEDKGLVKVIETSSGRICKVPECVPENPILEPSLSDIDNITSKNQLEDLGLELSNIVVSCDIGGSVNLEGLSREDGDIQYEPETSPMLVYRTSSSTTFMIPASGKITIVGSSSKSELINHISEEMPTIIDYCEKEVDKESLKNSLNVQNIVATGDLELELDLDKIATAIGLTQVEYDPSTFPALIYNPDSNTTVLLYSKGTVNIVGARTYAEVADGYRSMRNRLDEIGVDLN